MSDLIGKKKIIVDLESYASLPLVADENSTDSLSIAPDATAPISGMKFLSVKVPGAANELVSSGLDYQGRDTVRIAIGKYWNSKLINLATGKQKEDFSNDNHKPRLFFERALSLEYCNPGEVKNVATPGMQSTFMFTEEKIVLKCDLANLDTSNLAPGIDPSLDLWGYFVKAGVKSGQTSAEPIVDTKTTFFDHYNEANSPFSKKELLNKSPAGPAMFSDVSTYYNERLNSSYFESVAGNRALVQNSLPSVYSFLRLINNKEVTKEELFTLKELIKHFNEYFGWDYVVASTAIAKLDSMYTQLLQIYPFEVLATLFGEIGAAGSESEDLLESIVTFNSKKHDASGLYERYFNSAYAKKIAEDPKLSVDTDDTKAEHLLALERAMSNIIFSPNMLTVMDKIEKYKKHYPFYCQLDFKAQLNTKIGDLMKKTLMTRFLSEKLVAGFERSAHISPNGFLNLVYGADDLNGNDNDFDFDQNSTESKAFVDFYKESVYDNIQSLTVKAGEGTLLTNDKNTLDLIDVFDGPDGYLKNKNYMGSFEISLKDVKNYTAFLRNDLVEPANLDTDQNHLWKTIFGNMFYSSILNTYLDKRRTYKDIMNGVPAYTEDVFYRIKKLRKMYNEDEYKVVQNILIPNTSELDIAKYVDTQLKYSQYATYKYQVYAEKIVFGSKYEYFWTALDGTVVNEQFPKGDLQGPNAYSQDYSWTLGKNNEEYSAVCHVRVDPSIKIIEDLLFETPEILIMDKPPIAPFVNIVPYRAINNKIKIMLNGSVDRYRQKPVIINESVDKAEFDNIMAAQLSVDAKVEFGSDDLITSFQIFRTQTAPTSYTDFVPHPTIPSFTGNAFDDRILPNTKYWYTFRAIDAHGHVSNPTDVYEVELIDDHGAVKPLIRLHSMEKIDDRSDVTSVQKYLKIAPSSKQIFLSDLADTDSIYSTQDNKKRYKVRLVSKASGKKIDINFSFHREIQSSET